MNQTNSIHSVCRHKLLSVIIYPLIKVHDVHNMRTMLEKCAKILWNHFINWQNNGKSLYDNINQWHT